MTGKFQEEVTSGVFETSLPDMVAWNGMGMRPDIGISK